jgi:hypothetical protein
MYGRGNPSPEEVEMKKFLDRLRMELSEGQTHSYKIDQWTQGLRFWLDGLLICKVEVPWGNFHPITVDFRIYGKLFLTYPKSKKVEDVADTVRVHLRYRAKAHSEKLSQVNSDAWASGEPTPDNSSWG